MIERFEIVVRGVPIWLLRDYLQQVGGQGQVNGWCQGDGWRARLTQADDYAIGSLKVGQVKLEIEGEASAVARTRDGLEPRLLRGGG